MNTEDILSLFAEEKISLEGSLETEHFPMNTEMDPVLFSGNNVKYSPGHESTTSEYFSDCGMEGGEDMQKVFDDILNSNSSSESQDDLFNMINDAKLPDVWSSLGDDIFALNTVNTQFLNTESTNNTVNTTAQQHEEVTSSAQARRHSPPMKGVMTSNNTSRVLRPRPKRKQQVVNVEHIDSDCDDVELDDERKPHFSEAVKRPAAKTDHLEQKLRFADHTNRNAIQAKLNREKKKLYISELEERVDELTAENKRLSKQARRHDAELATAQEEVTYLRSVLANQSELAELLGKMGSSNLTLSSSFSAKRKRLHDAELDHDYPKERKIANHGGGVCLHVAGPQVSLEFCSQCSSMSTQSKRAGYD